MEFIIVHFPLHLSPSASAKLFSARQRTQEYQTYEFVPRLACGIVEEFRSHPFSIAHSRTADSSQRIFN